MMQFTLKYNPEKKGLRTLFREWQVTTLRILWENPEGALLMEIDYEELHPVQFHVVESLGPFTECTGFETNFKDTMYYENYNDAMENVESEAMRLGICYKLVDIHWCAQVHPDP